VVFVLGWIGVQVALVLTADRRPDGAFGFRVFSESTTMRVSLEREVLGRDGLSARVHVEGGTWVALDELGERHRYGWHDRVKRPTLAVFDSEVTPSDGARAQLWRLQAALDDVAAHLVGDVETKRLFLDVTIRRNGREPEVHHLKSAPVQSGGGS
jgi:hypothetical protein